jgi:radical SAM protein with 4Fe4S-binding SPASM domain
MLDLIRFFEDYGFTRIVLGRTVNPVKPSPVDCTNDDFLDLDRQEREEIIPWILTKLAAGEKPKYLPYAEEPDSDSDVSPFKCGACRGTTTVGADGSLYPCHRFVGMKAWQIGDVENGPDYAKCKDFWRRYRAAVAGDCESCWVWAQCKGPCPWEIAQSDGVFHRPRHCEIMKRYFERSAYFHSKKPVTTGDKVSDPD